MTTKPKPQSKSKPRKKSQHGRPKGTKPADAKAKATPKLEESQAKRVKDNTFNMRVDQIRARLDEMRQYKKILEEEGLKPDQDDKVLETQLIRRLLWLEKQHALPAGAPPAPKAKPKAADDEAEFKETPKKNSRRGKARGR